MRRTLLYTGFYAGLALLLFKLTPLSPVHQAAQETRTLIVNGQPSQVPVIQINGHAYADLEALATATNGSLTMKGNEVELSLPASSAGPPTTSSSSQTTGMSRGFLKAGIEAMSSLREWHSALANAIQNQYPIAENWLLNYQNQVSTDMKLALAAVSTDADRSAMDLLNSEFNNMKQLSDQYLGKVQSRDYIAPNSLQNDPLNQKIVKCGHSLAALAGGGQFQDDGSCH